MRQRVRRCGAAWCVALVCGLSASVAQAHVDGAASCGEHEVFVMRTRDVHVNAYLSGAQRGDVLLTSGGDGVPRAILGALWQVYNHTMLISQGDGGGGTLITHHTGLNIGLRTLELGLNQGVRWKPDELRRVPPGNVIGDRAQTLLYGLDANCLNREAVAACQHARPVNLWRDHNVLLRPNPALLSQAAIVDHAESIPERSLPYAFGAYSAHADSYAGVGVEAAFGAATMCSGFVAESLRSALVAQHVGHLAPQPVVYSNVQRFTAALALHNKLHTLFVNLLPNADGEITLGPLTVMVQQVIDSMVSQVVHCFAQGGACEQQTAWMAQHPVDYMASQPAPSQGQFYVVQPNTLGVGASISGDDLLDSALQSGWASVVPTQVMGDYSVTVFSHSECCAMDPHTGHFVQCRRVRPYSEAPDRTRAGGDLSAGTVSAPAPAQVRDYETILGWEGTFVEQGDAACYVTALGSVCTELPPRVVESAEEAEEADVSTRASR